SPAVRTSRRSRSSRPSSPMSPSPRRPSWACPMTNGDSGRWPTSCWGPAPRWTRPDSSRSSRPASPPTRRRAPWSSSMPSRRPRPGRSARTRCGSGRRDSPGRARRSLSGVRQGHVLQAQLTAGELLAGGGIGDDDLPQLLAPTLVEGAGLDVDPGAGARTQEVGGVVDADGEFPAISHGLTGADAGGAFDDGRVDTAVDHAPRCVVVLTEFG